MKISLEKKSTARYDIHTMKQKKDTQIFVCTFTDTSIKGIHVDTRGKREVIAFESSAAAFEDELKFKDHFKHVLHAIGYDKNYPLIISLPRSKATCRYVKIPSHNITEINTIVSLQAARFLPYPPEELITGFQVVKMHDDGFTSVSLTIVHKSIVERYRALIDELKITKYSIVLSSFGLLQTYLLKNNANNDTVLVIDADAGQIEMTVCMFGKMVFSRYFKLNRMLVNWKELFISEYRKTEDAFVKEVGGSINKVAVLSWSQQVKDIFDLMQEQIKTPVEFIALDKFVGIKDPYRTAICQSDTSLSSIFGLALAAIDPELNLLPAEIKSKLVQTEFNRKKNVLIMMSASLILGLLASFGLHIHNKQVYVQSLKRELKKVESQAQELSEIDKRFMLLVQRAKKKNFTVDILSELYNLIPPQITCTALTYSENKDVSIHGQATDLKPVLLLVSRLSQSAIFHDYKSEVKYATKKTTSQGDLIDFEVVALKQ